MRELLQAQRQDGPFSRWCVAPRAFAETHTRCRREQRDLVCLSGHERGAGVPAAGLTLEPAGRAPPRTPIWSGVDHGTGGAVTPDGKPLKSGAKTAGGCGAGQSPQG